jgi:uncharacterized protein (TIGR02246 family)
LDTAGSQGDRKDDDMTASSIQGRAASDEPAVRALYQRLMDGWNQGSGAAFAAVFTEDGDLVAFDGTHLEGRERIASVQQQLFDRFLTGTRLVGSVKGVRFLGPDTAVMHAVGNTIMRGKSRAAPHRASIQTMVAVRDGDQWRLAAFQNTRVRPIGRSAGTFLVWTLGDWLWRTLRLSTDPSPAPSTPRSSTRRTHASGTSP